MKLIIDAQLPPAFATALRKMGFDAMAVRDIGLREASDSDIWKYALQNDAVIVTRNEDFAERCLHSNNSPVVLWLRIGNATNDVLLAWFLPFLPDVSVRI